MRRLIFLLKLACSVLLLVLIFRFVNLGAVLRHLGSARIDMLVLALLAFSLQIVVLALRWVLVIRCLGGTLSAQRGITVAFMAQFFSQFLPSSVGGDVVRGWLAYRDGLSLKLSFHSVVTDRVVATLMLLVLIVLCIPFQGTLADAATIKSANVLVGTSLGGLCVLLALAAYLPRIEKAPRLLREAYSIADAIMGVVHDKRRSVPIIALSLFNHVLMVAGVWFLAVALALPVSWVEVLILAPLVMLMTLIPFSVSGWGVREGAMIVAFALVGLSTENAASLSVAFGLLPAIASLPGGLLWLFFRSSNVNVTTELHAVSHALAIHSRGDDAAPSKSLTAVR